MGSRSSLTILSKYFRFGLEIISVTILNLCVSQFGSVTIGLSLRSVGCCIVMQIEVNFLKASLINLFLRMFESR